MDRRWFPVLTLVIGLMLPGLAKAFGPPSRTSSFRFTASGSGTPVVIDLDGNGSSCTTINGFILCPADSALGIDGGNTVGGPTAGPFTAQSVSETVPTPGTGCSFDPSSIQSCTIGSVTNGCLYNYVGGNAVTRNTFTGDLAFETLTSGTLCINFNTSLPWNYEGQESWTITGGTGKISGASGSFTETFNGQILQNDFAGHGMSWNAGSGSGTITLPSP